MFERIARSIELVKTSWKILMDDKKLLAFPLLSGLALLFVIISFIIPIILTGQSANLTTKGSPLTLVLLFIFYLVSYFVVIFFNVGLITCMNARLQGRDATIGDGLANAARHIGKILAWALVSATVGLILQAIVDRTGFAGQIASAIVGGVWSFVAFFVVPILVLENKGVADSLRESFSLIKKTWGESIVGAGSIALIFVAIGILPFFGLLAALLTGNMIIFGIALVLFIFLIAALAIVASAMQGIFVTALWTYARTGAVPAAFNKEPVQNAFVPKQAGPGNI